MSLPYVKDSETSKAAAVAMAANRKFLNETYQRILVRIAAAPATCDEVEVSLGMKHQTASARIKDLRNAGLLEFTGEKRKTRSNCSASVYMVTQ